MTEAPRAITGIGDGRPSTNLGEILERVLDKGLVIAGDIRVNLLDIELLTIKVRLVIASLETAKEVGINWWERDPWLTANSTDDSRQVEDSRRQRELAAENARLKAELSELRALESGDE